MFTRTWNRFRALRPSVRALVGLMWLYDFGWKTIVLFFGIFLFQNFGTIESATWYFLVTFSFACIGFCGLGTLWARLRWNIKWLFFIGLGCLTFSFIFLFLGERTLTQALYFGGMNGFGVGTFWVSMHSFELFEIQDKERDFYSSMLRAGSGVLGILSPALAALSFFVSREVLGWGTYTLLFLFIPLSFALTFPFLRNVSNYRPKPIKLTDIKHFFGKSHHWEGIAYIGFGSAGHAFRSIVIPLVAVYLLGSEINVGIFETLIKIASVVFVVWLSHHRHKGNRIKIFGWCTVVLAVIRLLLGVSFDILAFIIFSLGFVFIEPHMNVSAHTLDLALVENLKRKQADFFPALVIRDFTIWFFRSVASILILLIVFVLQDIETSLRVLVLISILWPVGRFFMVKKFFRR